jgi:protein-tyrosine phosphatase
MTATTEVSSIVRQRLVALDAAHNFRDMGGYVTADGRRTRWELLYRADGLGSLTDGDLEVVRELALRTVIDLRSHRELQSRGRFPHDKIAVDFAHLPILDVLWDEEERPRDGDAESFLLEAYEDMLRQGASRFAAAITRLAEPGALPAVFHCAAGKDRTGLLAALVLSALGVDREEVLADYALTTAGIERMFAWAERESPEWARKLNAEPTWFFAAVPAALDRLLDQLCEAHGSITEYLVSIGVEQSTLARLADALLAE